MYIEASFIDISTLDMECIMDLIIISRFNSFSQLLWVDSRDIRLRLYLRRLSLLLRWCNTGPNQDVYSCKRKPKRRARRALIVREQLAVVIVLEF